MSPDKVASQVAHSVIGLGATDLLCTIIVLGVSDEQFNGHYLNFNCYVHDQSCLAYYDER
jgi:hypothetical protein